MVSLTIGLLVLCVCGPFLRPSYTAPIQEEDNNNERSFKRELELFTNEIEDEWEQDDNEYLSRRELQEANEREKKLWNNNLNKNYLSNEDDKRWLDIDTPRNGVSKQERSPNDDDELPKNGELFQEDIVMDDYVRAVFNGEAEKRDAVSLDTYRWPNRIFHYEFDPKIDHMSRKVIECAMKEYHKYTCIRFEEKAPGDGIKDYVRFISNGSSCYSNVGRRGGRQDVSIGYGCLRVGTPIHEMMHVLGFFHEMARPDRDENVVIHWNEIKPNLKHNFRKISDWLDLKLIGYNFNSVMQYSNYAFSATGARTITAINDPELKFGQRCGFSVGDVVEVNKLYKCPEYNKRWESVSHGTELCAKCEINK